MLAALALLAPQCANAGAWVLDRGHWQSYTTSTISAADRGFDASGHLAVRVPLTKILIQNEFEYGLTRHITAFAIPALADVSYRAGTSGSSHYRSTSLEGGLRLGLGTPIGRFSLQGSFKSAGGFDLSVSANRESGRQYELRVLYGTGFKVLSMDGFADMQIAQRWVARPRPDEIPVDLTVGLWVRRGTMLMLQSFNDFSEGQAAAPFVNYRTHKVQASIVERLSRHWLLQTGVFVSPVGRNALVERGVSVVLWTQD